MKTIKPGALSLLTRTVEHRGRFLFVVSPLLFVSLEGPVRLRSEVAMWKFAAAELGKNAILDAGMPKTVPEFLIHGNAYAPATEPVQAMAVRARVGAREKKLLVFGDRQWEGRQASTPQAYTQMPLAWSRAYGGPGFAENLEGRGFATEQADGLALPNLEYPDDRVTRPGQAVRPAGFGPRDIMHPERAALAGTYDEAWLKTDFPGYARDMNGKLFNVAPPDQWLEGTMDGRESWEFENLHPTKRVIQGVLPGFATRCFYVRSAAKGDRLGEIHTRFDTVWFFPAHECAVLVGRGVVEVQEDDAADIRVLVGAVEWADERRDAAHYEEAMRRRLDPETGHFAILQEDDLLPSGIGQRYGVERLSESPPEVLTLMSENLRRRQLAQIEEARAKVRHYGLDPDAGHGPALPGPTPVMPRIEEIPALIADLKRQAEALKVEKAEREVKLDVKRRASAAAAGFDYAVVEKETSAKPKGPPKFTAKSKVDHLKQVRAAVEANGGPAAEIDQYLLDPAFLDRLAQAERAGLEGYRLQAHLQDAADAMPPQRAQAVREKARSHHGERRSFAGMNLTGADFSGLDLGGADFSGALLEAANLSGSRLEGCDFSQAVLARANLSGANLADARLEKANLGEAICVGTNFDRALLGEAILAGANLAQAHFLGADLRRVTLGKGALWDATDWSGATATDLMLVDASLQGLILRNANLERSVLIRCNFERVDFSGARFPRSVFVSCAGAGASFRNAELSGVVFVSGNDLRGCDFSGASLASCAFRPSDLSAARFDRATLKQVDFSECVLRDASFAMATALECRYTRADLSAVRFASANLMGSDLQKARMEDADFRNSNLYAADFARVLVNGNTRFGGALMDKIRTYPRRRAVGDQA